MADVFPGVGHKYMVDFATDDGTRGFKVQLDFHSMTSLTYTSANSDGTLTGNSETVTIAIQPIRDMLFLVTWKEEFGTTVVHLEDYKDMRITTNITSPTADPKKPSFMKLSGPMTKIS
jgi:hypothetical protein